MMYPNDEYPYNDSNLTNTGAGGDVPTDSASAEPSAPCGETAPEQAASGAAPQPSVSDPTPESTGSDLGATPSASENAAAQGESAPTQQGASGADYRTGEWSGSPYAGTAGHATSGDWSASPYTSGTAGSGSTDSGAWNRASYTTGAGYTGTTGGSNTTPPTPPKHKKTKVRTALSGGRLVALCLVCALVGGCFSGGLVALLTSRNQSSTTASTTVLESSRPVTTVQTAQVEAGEEMSVAEIYATYSGSVVCIEVSTSSGTGAGTGFVITSDGYIVTAYHVIDGATDIAITFTDSTSYPATLIGGDEDNDIAVLKIDATDLTPVVLGDSTQLQVGDTVTAIGNALGTLANTTTTGVISGLDRAIEMSDGTVINVLQTDCTVNSGNSGGPLFNAYGEVIGVVNAKYSSSGSSSAATIEGIGFAIPYADVKDKITDLIAYGYITGKPSLGITVSTVTALEAQRFNMVVGAYVNSVTEGSCAEAGGLKQGDIITGVDGTEITTYEELVNAKNQHSAGDEMELEVWRSGEELTITVVLDEQVPEQETTTDDTDTTDDSDTTDSYDPYGQDGQDSQDESGMSPEDFFGGNGNSNDNSNGNGFGGFGGFGFGGNGNSNGNSGNQSGNSGRGGW
jgi:serine protease Do